MSIFFSNPSEILDHKFKEMVDRWVISNEKTDDYHLRQEIKRILASDYYNDALTWLNTFREAEWWKEDLC